MGVAFCPRGGVTGRQNPEVPKLKRGEMKDWIFRRERKNRD